MLDEDKEVSKGAEKVFGKENKGDVKEARLVKAKDLYFCAAITSSFAMDKLKLKCLTGSDRSICCPSQLQRCVALFTA